jgi:hypothetical protein
MIRPMFRPVLAVVLLVVMAGAWYWALGPTVRPAARPPGSTRLPASSANPLVPVVRLDHLAAEAAHHPLPLDHRNPFRDGPSPSAGPAPSAPASTVARPEATQSPLRAPAPEWPRLELIGLAETSGEGGLVRTAIVSGAFGVSHARPGDVLEGVYRLERIGVDSVEVRLLPEDRVIRFPLRR